MSVTDSELRSCIDQSCALADRGAIEDALDVLDHGLQAATSSGDARWAVLLARHAAVIAEHAADVGRAVRYLELALQYRADDIIALYAVADLYGRLGDGARASECFLKCLELSNAQHNLGMIELLAARGFRID